MAEGARMILSLALRRMLAALAFIAIAIFSTHVAAMTTMEMPALPQAAVTAVDHHAAGLIHGAEGHETAGESGDHAQGHLGMTCCGQGCTTLIPLGEAPQLAVQIACSRYVPDLGQAVDGNEPDTARRPPK